MGSPYETFVLVEVVNTNISMSQPGTLHILRSYLDKARGEEALELLRDTFTPEHLRRFDLLTVPHID